MKVRYTETAFAELTEIFHYIAADNPKAAKAVVARLERLTESLRGFPHMARFVDEQGAHIVRIGRYPYLLFYVVNGDEIVILHVRHASRRSPSP